ncbi:MAG: hypothetical protein ABL997_11720 [Planctomycetota bacterium]
MRSLLLRVTAPLLALLAWTPLVAQCCNGAQDCVQTSPNSRYRVRAESRTGTGHKAHGPYRFTFTLEESVPGTWRELGHFERGFDSRAHFNMSLAVSDSGNGFLLGTSMDRRVVLLSCDGKELADLKPAPAGSIASLWTRSNASYWLRGMREFENRRCDVFVPFGEAMRERENDRAPASGTAPPATPTERWWPPRAVERAFRVRMLTWTPTIGERDREAAAAAIVRLQGDDAGQHELAARSLQKMGWSSVAPIEAATTDAATTTAARARLVELRAELDRLACGHRHPWRNLDLLMALRAHEDEAYREASAAQLRRLLPQQPEPSAEWMAEHRDALQWDEKEGHFVEIKER